MKKFYGILIPLALLLAALVLRQQDPYAIQQLRNLVFDNYQRLSPRPYDPTLPIRIGDIDEKSLNHFGQWPWSRAQIAAVVDRLRELGAATIALDIIFGETDRTSPRAIAATLPADARFDNARQMMAGLPDPDQILADAIARVPTVVSFAAMHSDPLRVQSPPLTKFGYSFSGDDPHGVVPSYPFWISTLPILQKAAAGVGAVNSDPDRDSIVRRVPIFVNLPIPEEPIPFRPTLAVEALRVAQGQTTYQVKASSGSGESVLGNIAGISRIRIGQAIVPTNTNGSILLYDTGHEPQRYFSLADLWNDNFDPGIVAGRIIFVGSTVHGLRDFKATPLAGDMAGVEIHAQIAEQIVSGSYLQRPVWAGDLEFLALLLLGLVLVALAQLRFALLGFGVAIVAIAGAFGTSYYFFVTKGFLLDPLYPAGTAFLIFVAATLIGFIRTEREKAQVRGAFSLYLSPVLVDRVSENREKLKLGGENRPLTVMFCDIRGFTKMSEGLDPQQLTHVINQFLTPMTGIIHRHSGTIDKYIGDCIMAFWNAPLDIAAHERKAVMAAYDMRAELIRLNETLAAEARTTDARPVTIRVGIGLNTGIACVGNMGSEQRFNYSALGDTVNIASRLESLSPAYGLDLVIGEETAEAVPDFALLEIDQVRVKGKNRPVRIYTGLGNEEVAATNSYLVLKPLHEKMLAAYRAQDWDAAEMALTAAREAAPEQLSALYDLYAERITAYRAAPPPEDWDGVFEARSKAG
ncbi:CHASE2 domain-containing protein [Dongia sp.]|uniref:CHASE2 domain-containing protein n=1 Tax=Dongia sp. TaxID=1977262 RepID=UPI0035AE101D